MKKLISIITTLIIICTGVFSSLIASAENRESYTSGSFTYYKLSSEDGNAYLGDFVDYLKGQIPTWHLQNYFIAYQCYSFGSQDIYVYYYYAFDKSVTSIDLSYNSAITLDKVIAYGSSQLYISDNIVTGYYGNAYSTYGIDNPGNYLNNYKVSVYKDGFANDGQTYILRSSNLQIYVDDVDITPADLSAPPTPFTVSYTPELFEGMSREIQYPSKGGGYVTGENNNIGIDITLTDDVKTKICKNSELGNAYGNSTYSVVCCISKSPVDENTNMKVFFENEVVLYGIGKDNYYLGSDSPDDEDFHTYLAVANGYTSILTIPQDSKLHVDFDLTHIDYEAHSITTDTKLYVNVIGIFSKNNGQVKVDNGETTENESENSTWMGAYSYQSSFVNLEKGFEVDNILKNVNEDGSLEQIKYYKSYTFNSDSFNYVDYPEYSPKIIKDEDGNTYNPTSSSLKDLCNIKPESITDVDIKESGSKPLSPDDYKEYENNKLISSNVDDFDFNITSITSIFDGSSDFFKFLTASIALLPPYFMTILISFFTIMLAIVIIKFVV